MKNNKTVIYVVDDEPAICRLIRIALEDTDYEIKEAHSGTDFLEKLKDGPLPQLALLDVMMPKMNGYDVCKFIKSDNTLNSIKIILFSALSESDMKIKAEDAGADAYFSKNMELEELREEIIKQL
ncbi:MAG: response regulator [Candidatus Goldbacteria bacterium]|nr:response regulator [Candidatus Goldiibacteriota bacterium]